jgi:hypothetical protein
MRMTEFTLSWCHLLHDLQTAIVAVNPEAAQLGEDLGNGNECGNQCPRRTDAEAMVAGPTGLSGCAASFS